MNGYGYAPPPPPAQCKSPEKIANNTLGPLSILLLLHNNTDCAEGTGVKASAIE